MCAKSSYFLLTFIDKRSNIIVSLEPWKPIFKPVKVITLLVFWATLKNPFT